MARIRTKSVIKRLLERKISGHRTGVKSSDRTRKRSTPVKRRRRTKTRAGSYRAATDYGAKDINSALEHIFDIVISDVFESGGMVQKDYLITIDNDRSPVDFEIEASFYTEALYDKDQVEEEIREGMSYEGCEILEASLIIDNLRTGSYLCDFLFEGEIKHIDDFMKQFA